jgi:hypothetical protein
MSCIVNSAAIYIMVVKFINTTCPPQPQLSLHRRAALSSYSNWTRREDPKRSLYCEMSVDQTPWRCCHLYSKFIGIILQAKVAQQQQRKRKRRRRRSNLIRSHQRSWRMTRALPRRRRSRRRSWTSWRRSTSRYLRDRNARGFSSGCFCSPNVEEKFCSNVGSQAQNETH